MKKTTLTLCLAAAATAAVAFAAPDKIVRIVKADGTVISEHVATDIKHIEVVDGEVTPEFKDQEFTVNGVTFKMIAVEGGTYKMGDDNSSNASEKPAHDETIGDFYIGQTEVTQELWQAVMGSNPSNFKGESNLPVEQVSWTDCNTFITKLNNLTGKTFRLPTEPEWEYAARGGNKSQGYTYSGSNTIGDVSWYDGNSSSKTHPVAQKQANELGLYDMSGNVDEWTSDKYSTDYNSPRTSSYRVNRGGSWSYAATDSRVANRYENSESFMNDFLGLRLAL